MSIVIHGCIREWVYDTLCRYLFIYILTSFFVLLTFKDVCSSVQSWRLYSKMYAERHRLNWNAKLIRLEKYIWTFHEFCDGMKLMSKAHFKGNAIQYSNVIFGNLKSFNGRKMVKNESVLTNSIYLVNNIINWCLKSPENEKNLRLSSLCRGTSSH